MDRSSRTAVWIWSACYVLLMAAVIWSLFAARRWALSQLATAESVGEWQVWREDVKRQQGGTVPVQRRVPKSDAPPAWVLMRDYFAVSLVGAIVFATVLYWIMVWFVTGILRHPDDAAPMSQ